MPADFAGVCPLVLICKHTRFCPGHVGSVHAQAATAGVSLLQSIISQARPDRDLPVAMLQGMMTA